MEIKVLGLEINLINVAICIALGFFICVMIGCDCVNWHGKCGCDKSKSCCNKGKSCCNKGKSNPSKPGSVKEGFINGSITELTNNITSSLSSVVGLDSDSNKKGAKGSLVASVQGPSSILAQTDNMFYLENNEFNSQCCPTNYSSSIGCACLSDKQYAFLRSRGGNR